MKQKMLFSWIAVIALFIMGVGSADVISGWNGTWLSENFELTIVQTDDGRVTGTYLPFDPMSGDPGVIDGSIGADGKNLSGVWTETGTCSFILSDDEQFFNGTYDSEDANGKKNEAGWNGTRISSEESDETGWTGRWISDVDIVHLVQNGSVVTGTYEPIHTAVIDLVEPGTIEGTLSGDGKVFTGTWKESGGILFTLSDDSLFFNGTYRYGDTDLVGGSDTYHWNATRIV